MFYVLFRTFQRLNHEFRRITVSFNHIGMCSNFRIFVKFKVIDGKVLKIVFFTCTIYGFRESVNTMEPGRTSLIIWFLRLLHLLFLTLMTNIFFVQYFPLYQQPKRLLPFALNSICVFQLCSSISTIIPSPPMTIS